MSFLTRISGSIRPITLTASRYYTSGAVVAGKKAKERRKKKKNSNVMLTLL